MRQRKSHGVDDHGDAEAVAHVLGGDRFAALGVEDDDQVGHRDDDLTVAQGDEVFVLETKLEHRAGVVAGAFDLRLATRKSGFGTARDVGDLAGEDTESSR